MAQLVGDWGTMKGALDAEWVKQRCFPVVPAGLQRHIFRAGGGGNGATNTVAGSGAMLGRVVPHVWQKTPLTGEELKKRLLKAGWRYLDCGSFSTVYLHPKHPDKVIKINNRPDPWPMYIQWAIENGELGHAAPMVYSIKLLDKDPGGSRGAYWAVMERLQYYEEQGYGYTNTPVYPALKEWASSRGFGWDCSRLNVMTRASTKETVYTDPVCHTCNTPIKPWSLKRWLRTHSLPSPSHSLKPSVSSGTVTPEPTPPSTKELGKPSSTKAPKHPSAPGNNAQSLPF